MHSYFHHLENWASLPDSEIVKIKQEIEKLCSEHKVELPEGFKICPKRYPMSIEAKLHGYQLQITDTEIRPIARLKLLAPEGKLVFLAVQSTAISVQKREEAERQDRRIPFPASLDDRYMLDCKEDHKPYVFDEQEQKEIPVEFLYSKLADGTRYTADKYNHHGWEPTIFKRDTIIRMPVYDHTFHGKRWLALVLFNFYCGENLYPCLLCPSTGEMRVVGNMCCVDYPIPFSFCLTEDGKGVQVYQESDEPNEEVKFVSKENREMINLDDVYSNRTGWEEIPFDEETFITHSLLDQIDFEIPQPKS
jgi:hypothetical protein